MGAPKSCKTAAVMNLLGKGPAAEPVPVQQGQVRDIEVITREILDDMGAVIAGRQARPEEERPELYVGFVPHWRTCPCAHYDGAPRYIRI